MFKYCWIIILAVIWIVWLIATVIDIIDTYRLVGFSRLFSMLEDYSQAFIITMSLGFFAASFISWFLSLG